MQNRPARKHASFNKYNLYGIPQALLDEISIFKSSNHCRSGPWESHHPQEIFFQTDSSLCRVVHSLGMSQDRSCNIMILGQGMKEQASHFLRQEASTGSVFSFSVYAQDTVFNPGHNILKVNLMN